MPSPTAEVALRCTDLAAELAFFTELGFTVLRVIPADDPDEVAIEGLGLRLRLCRGPRDEPLQLHLGADADAERVSPGGTRVSFAAPTPLQLPANRPDATIAWARDAVWQRGRAGMAYRDLLPGRQGGRFVISQIRLEHGGDVPDWVHHHRIRAQLIVCLRGWVRVVYEDQGPPIVMQPGDCVLQPPGIRHRVLACAAMTEVLELASPAAHETHSDPAMTLPTARVLPERDFGGQRFCFHRAANAPRERIPPAIVRDLGLFDPSGGLVRARALQLDAGATWRLALAGELAFAYVLAGDATLQRPEHDAVALGPGDAFALSPGPAAHLVARSGLELLVLEL
jgi:quercetin dioxygenase-like cupin family protein